MTVRSHCVLDKNNHSRFIRIQQIIYSVSAQQHVSAQRAIVRVAIMEDKYTVYIKIRDLIFLP